MNTLHIGFTKHVEPPPKGFLFIHDEVPPMTHAQVFEPAKHSLNPLKGITYKKARALAEVLYSITLQGENTLTVRDGKRELFKALLRSRRLDLIKSDSDEVNDMIGDLLMSPVLRKVLCNSTNFAFSARSSILAKIDRAVLGDFDALVLGLVLINHFQGQIVIPDLGFYGRDAHISLIREKRLIAGVNFLDELPLRLKRAALLIKDKEASGALYEDAVTLAKYDGTFQVNQNGFIDIITAAMRHSSLD